MPDLQSMTLAERMTTINNAEHSLTNGIHDFTFQEACNTWLRETGTVNSVDYSGISINKYTPEEAFAIIRHKVDLRSETLNELVSELGSYYPIHKYTATEALNKKNAVLAPYSLSFDGDNDYVELGNQAGVLRLADSDGTISAWVKIVDVSADDRYKRIVDKSDAGGASKGYSLIVDGDDSTNSGVISGWISGGNRTGNSTVFVQDNEWTHIVWTWDGTNHKIYVNGVLDVTNAETTRPPSDAANMRFGTWNHSTEREFKGKMDEVSIFNKALTQAEITSLYAADPQNAGDAVGITNLVGYWKFDEGTGEPQDTSGNDNHGTLAGATWTVH